MKKLFLLILLLCEAFLQGYCQDITLQQSISNIAAQVKQVKTADGQIDQKINQVKDNIIAVAVTKTDNKGKASTESYKFNLADINGGGVKEVLAGTVMYVDVPVKDNNKYIEATKDGKFSGYQSNLKITVNDVDNSRALISAIQASVTIAEKMELAKYNFSSQDEILANLYKAIQTTPDNVNVQKIKSTADKKEKLDFTNLKDGKTEMYEFNLSDINPAKIAVKISGFLGILPGKALSVSLETTGGQKIIKQSENDVPKSYISNFNIYPTDIENAKQIKALFYLAIQNIKSGITNLPDFLYSAVVSPATNKEPGTIAKSGDETGKSVNATLNNSHLIKSKAVYNITTANYKEPEFVGQAEFINQDTGTTALEKQIPHYTTKADATAKVFGMGKVTKRIVVSNPASPVRVRAGEPLSIIINAGSNNMDPFAVIHIFKIDPKTDRRETELASNSSFTGASSGDLAYIKFQGNKFGQTSYLLNIDKVPTGEYGITIEGIKDIVSLFGADN